MRKNSQRTKEGLEGSDKIDALVGEADWGKRIDDTRIIDIRNSLKKEREREREW